MAERKIAKIILEIKYSHAPLLFDKRGAIARKWRGVHGLSDWRISTDQVTLHNREETVFFDVQLTRLVSVMEFPRNKSEFTQFASEVSSYAVEILGINRISRIGLRVLQFEDRNDFSSLLNGIRQRLCLISDDDWGKIGAAVTDVGISYVITLGENSGNFNLGPMEKDQLSSFFSSEVSKMNLPDTCLFIDFDLYKLQPNPSSLSSKGKLANFLSSGLDEITSFTDKFLGLYGGFE